MPEYASKEKQREVGISSSLLAQLAWPASRGLQLSSISSEGTPKNARGGCWCFVGRAAPGARRSSRGFRGVAIRVYQSGSSGFWLAPGRREA
ncbi:hypothetical protein KM043_003429 [Ampulex compressa]|nr:hypothetical protein KM043_003429 [Ampulex compressa]